MKEVHQLKPYKLAKLYIPKPSSKDQRWTVCYHAWNAKLNKLERVRVIFSDPDLKERKRRALELIGDVNALLRKGATLDTEPEEKKAVEEAPKKMITVGKAIEIWLAEKMKHRPRTYRSYENLINTFKEWLEAQYMITLSMDAFKTTHIRKYVQYVESATIDGKPRWGKRSRNNLVTTVKTFFNYFVEVEELIKESPARKEKKIKTPKGVNLPYRPEQRQELIEFMKARQPQLLFLTQFIFHTLARPNEISNIKIKHIGMYNTKKIYLHADHAKNEHERHISISPALQKLLKNHIPKKVNPEWYLFSKGFKPGPEWYNSKYFGERYRENVLDHLKYHKDFTLYSWKHTAVVMAVEAGVPHADIIMQGGWTDPHSYFTYLKGLGLMVNEGVENKWPDLLGDY